ncbi:TREM1 protein, partial [Thalassarche chlororhynchos]|nr:TREM1 protein [Thalassarche chlororhynchos]
LRVLLLLLLCFPGLQAQTPDSEESRSEGSTLYIQCPYTAQANYQQPKAWYRRRDNEWELLVETTNPREYSYTTRATKGKVTIEDNATRGTMSITMTNLQAEDSGTYFCAYRSYSNQYFPVKMISLNVFKVLAGTTLSGTAGTSQTTPSGNTPAPSSNVNTFILLFGVLSILFILALITSITLCVRRRKQLKRRGTRQAEDTYDKPEDIAQLDSTERMESPKDDSKDLKYVTLNFNSRLSPEDPLYCNVELSQTHRKPKDENVEYAIVALKQLPMNDK